ncbi:MAG: protein kinase [Caldimonas sp.]
MNPDDEDDRTIVRPKTVNPAAVPDPATSAPDRTMRASQMPAGPQTAPTTGPPPTTGPNATVASTQHTLTLPAGTRLAEFEITQTIGEGGFGIVYLAWDHSLQRKVALKEYMPSSIAYRIGETEVKARSARHQDTFEAGLKSFINESRLLAQFDHPSLLKVYRFWEANGTAYMVMPFLEGTTLRDTVRGLAEPPGEDWIVALLTPLCDALGMLHAAQCFHRDIAPDNILLLTDGGRPLLLDFGAARRVIGDMTQALTAILKPGYAPIEQYAEVPGLKQGAWTDVYALAAVVHWMITGKTPSPSVGRMFDNSHVPLVERAAGRYSPGFLAAVDRGLAVMPEHRTQTIEDFRRELGGAGAAPRPAEPAMAEVAGVAPLGPSTVPRTKGPGEDERTRQFEPRAPARPAASAAPTSGSRRWLVPAAAAALAAAAAVAYIVLTRPDQAAEPTVPSAALPTPAAATPAVAESPVQPAATAPSAIVAIPPETTSPASATKVTPTAPTTTGPPAEVAGERSATTARSSKPRVVEAAKPKEEEIPARPPARRTPVERAERPADPPRQEPRANGSNEAECGRLFQRLSIGESSPELIERVRALRCR